MTAPSTSRTATLVVVTYLVPAHRWFYRTLPAVLDHVPDPVRDAANAPDEAFALFYTGDGEIVHEDGTKPPQLMFQNGARTTNFFIPSRGELWTLDMVIDRPLQSEHRRKGILRYMEINHCDHVFFFGPDDDKRAMKYYDGADQLVPANY